MHDAGGGIFRMSTLLGGLDIGGTKCAAVLGRAEGDRIEIVGKHSFPTPDTPEEALASLCDELACLAASAGGGEPLAAVGVSCGGPLDSRRGRILSPPNLPGWDGIDVLTPLRERFGVPAALQNAPTPAPSPNGGGGRARGVQHDLPDLRDRNGCGSDPERSAVCRRK
ncbi:ROK family protein [Paenibacillus sp. AR247]|uniref:ROK family protein n=1 Tax=Paenibacillus sp. AR247 TaxID=1631599 RepID=UPI00215730FA|nr:ROK family protein [Paenibacillus sp. AR247]